MMTPADKPNPTSAAGVISWTAVLLLAILAAGVTVTGWTVHRADREMRQDFLVEARRMMQGLNANNILRLAGTADDLTSPEYQRLKSQLGLIKHTLAKCRFVYLMGCKADGTLFFFADSEPPESAGYSPPGQVYGEGGDEEARVFKTATALVTGPAPDRWGTWVSALTPIVQSRTGAVSAVLGIDIDARVWHRERVLAALPPALLTLALIAILLVGSVLLLRHRRRTGTKLHRAVHIKLALMAATGVAVTLFAVSTAHDRDLRRHQRWVTQLADSETHRIAHVFQNVHDTELASLAHFIESDEHISPAEFQYFAAPLTQKTAILAWEWVPVVADATKAQFEQETRAADLPTFEVWQRDANGQRTPAQGRDLYYPVLYVSPLAGNERAVGYDVGSELVRRETLADATRTGLVTASDPIDLVQGTHREKGMVIFHPVFLTGEPQRLRGFAVAVLRLEAAIGTVQDKTTMHLNLSLVKADGRRELLYASCEARPESGQRTFATRPVAAFGKLFLVSVHPDETVVTPYRSYAGVWALLVGLLVTVTLMLLLGVPLRRSDELERMVAERTAKLAKEEERLTATLHSMGDGVLETDPAGLIVTLNSAAERLTGWSAAEALGRPGDEVFRLVNVQTGATTAVGERAATDADRLATLIAKNGTTLQISTCRTPIRSEHAIFAGTVTVFRDVTREQHAQRLTQLRLSLLKYADSHSWDELLGQALDDIGDLLNSPIGFCHLLSTDQKTLTLQQWSTRTRKEFCQARDHGRHYSLEQAGVWTECVGKRKPVIHNDYASLPHRKGLPEGHAPVVRELVTPVLRGNRVVAILGVGNKPDDYTEEDADTIHYLADMTWDLVEKNRVDQALRDSQARYEQLAAQSRSFAWAVDAAGRYTYVSPTVEQALGYLPAELVETKYFYDLHPTASREDFKSAAFAVFARKGRFTGLENAAVAKNGRAVWLATTGLPILDGNGDLLGYHGTDIDITERKQAEDDKSRTERKYRELVDCANSIILRWTRDGEITFLNEFGQRFFGYSESEILGRHVVGTIVPETESTGRDLHLLIDHICADPKAFESNINENMRHDGQKVWVAWSNKVDFDDHGQVAGIISVGMDITERKVAADQLQTLLAESNQSRQALLGILEDMERAKANTRRLATAVEQAAEMIVITDATGRIQYVNPAFETVTGYRRDEAIGQNPRLLKSGKQNAAFYREMWSALAAGRTWQGRFVNRKKDGTLYTEETTISPMRDNAGRIVSFVGVKRDITEHLQMTEQVQQAQKMESVGRLAGGVAHDFNNILQVIQGTVEMAKERVKPEDPLMTELEEIRSVAERAADLTRQLLAFARKQTIAPRVLDLNETIGNMLRMLRRLIGENITLAWEPGVELWPVRMDPSQVDQLLANLCVNARDAIGGVGKVTIETANSTIAAAQCAQHPGAVAGAYVRIAVRDTGCGMTPDVLAHIFEPFFTTKDVGKGTGLGLATVYGIVKQNAGWLEVWSEPGKGTIFSLYLPRLVGKFDAVTAAAPLVAPPGGRETILLVEDEKPVRTIARRILEQLGYTVVVAETPEDGLRLAAKHAGDIRLLITDVIMPGMNGQVLAKRLAETLPGLKCLFISGYTADVISPHGTIDASVPFLAKPFSRDALARKVREVLEREG